MLSAGFNLVNPLAVAVTFGRKRFFLFFLTLRTNALLDVFRTGIGYDLPLAEFVTFYGKRLKLLVVAFGTYALLGVHCACVYNIRPRPVAVTFGRNRNYFLAVAFGAYALLRVHCACVYNVLPFAVFVRASAGVIVWVIVGLFLCGRGLRFVAENSVYKIARGKTYRQSGKRKR